MQKTWKKALALALALCAVLGLMVPMAGSADAAEETSTSVLDQYVDENGLYRGPLTDLGIALHGDMGFSDESELLDYNGEQYLLTPAEGGILFVFRLSEFLRGGDSSPESWLYDQVEIGGEFRSIVCDSYGVAYISNGGDNIYVYDISKKSAEGTTPLDTISLGKDVGAKYIAIDENNNLYVTTGSCKVFKISYNGREITELCDLSEDIVDMAGIVYGGGKVYVSGNKKITDTDSEKGSYIYKVLPYISSEPVEASYEFNEDSGGFTYLSYAGGLLFAGNTTSCGSMVILNTNDLSETAIPMKLRILNTDAAGNELEGNSKKYLELTDPAYENYKEQYYDACYSKMSILGMVTEPRNGYIYFLTSDSYDGIDSNTDADQMNKGFWRFNISAWAEGDPQPAEHVHSFNSKGIDSKNSALRVRDPYVTVTDSETGDTSTYLFTSSPDTPYLWWIENSNPDNEVYAPSGSSLSPLLTDAYTIKKTRSIAAGTGTDSTPAAYVGGYLTPVVASFNPSDVTPLNQHLFSQGHAQTDSMVAYEGKLYAGCYNGAYLVEYDPNAPIREDDPKTENINEANPKDLIPGGISSLTSVTPKQIRIHALAAGDDKLFFSTIPGDQKLGGIVGYFDLAGFGEEDDTKNLAERLVILGELVPKQSIISLVYDAEKDMLYGASSKYGGTNTGSSHLNDTSYTAMIMVFDVAEWETNQTLSTAHKGNFSITEMKLLSDSSPTFPESKPWYIDGIGQDPVSRKLWGVVDQTIFSFSYDKDANTLSVIEEIAGRKSNYQAQGNPNWFPRPILFDGNGNVYIQRFGQQVCRYTLDDDKKLTNETPMGKETRCYTLGTDGNLYMINFHGTNIWRVSMNRVSITEDLIYAASIDDETSVTTAEAAYNELSAEEKAQVGSYYTQKLYGLQGVECLLNGEGYSLDNAMSTAVSGDTVTLLISQTRDNITVNNGIIFDLGGKNITGDVTVENGTLALNGGIITGNVTLKNGSVDLNGGSITGSVTVEDGTLDLNGGIITGSLAASGGIVKDSTGGVGYITETVDLPKDNGYLPLKDTVGYRLYSYKAESLGTDWDEEKADQMNFWFDLSFDNEGAYSLLASSSDTELEVWAEVYVNDVKLPDVCFNENETVRDWAGQEHDTDNYALFVGTTNMPDSLITIKVIPHLEANGVEVIMDVLSVKVGPLTAEAFFAPWLNSSVN